MRSHCKKQVGGGSVMAFLAQWAERPERGPGLLASPCRLCQGLAGSTVRNALRKGRGLAPGAG